ncbi:GATA transcription factor 2 [Phoenix dactylifera]|uniref:GATA transcription factor 2 n=1 Tax=Phoenix dactylifera TaxID=42345 RepID=A0A8B7BR02_PHODC|nr:GATA transcription factor 2 [Phoenix dactylifera]
MPIVHPYLSSPAFEHEEILEDGVEEVVGDSELCKPNDPEKQEWFQDLLDSLLDFLPLSDAGDVEESTKVAAFADWRVPKKRRTGQLVRRRAWSLDPPARLLYHDHLSRDGDDFSMLKKCTHCITMDTPQWRNGPAGPGTLCNACGIRYKSGRLLPEYRPASSPAFGSSGYANNHKKVLKIRETKKSRGDDEDVLC